MARRVRLFIDTINADNDVVFEVYRAEETGVSEKSTHVMTVDDVTAKKERYKEVTEVLRRDPDTPYAFFSQRHFEILPFPSVTVGSKTIRMSDVDVFPDDKMIEIRNEDFGPGDGKTVRMSYEYLAIPVFDDGRIEAGKEYIGPPATGLRKPLSLQIVQDPLTKKIKITVSPDAGTSHYFYKIYAKDKYGNKSPWSDEHHIALTPSNVYYRIQRSKDGKDWEEVTVTDLQEWLDDLHASDNPMNVKNMQALPIASKISKLTFDNPWYQNTDKRNSYRYRVRAEDSDGMATDWVYIEPIEIKVDLSKIVIRRKLDNKAPSSFDKTDAITVFTIEKKDVDVTQKTITLVDDQLTDASKYSYTFFAIDELGMMADPVYVVSDNRTWKNVILFVGDTETDTIKEKDFHLSFELADRIIEIGEGDGD